MNMIKNFENFVNEGFLDSVFAGIDAGIGAFKANRSAEKAADAELLDILDGRAGEFSNKVKLTALVKQLVEKSAYLADGFSYDKLGDGAYDDLDNMVARMERIETIISEMKEILTEDFNVKF